MKWQPPKTFPFIVPASTKLVEEFMGSEYGRYEDLGGRDQDDPCPPDDDYDEPWFCGVQILMRRNQGIEIRNEQELQEIAWAIASGTTGLQGWGIYRAACCLQDKLWAAAETLGIDLHEYAMSRPECPEFGVGQQYA